MLPRLPHCSSCLAKLDRIAWDGGVTFVSHGARIGIRVSDARVLTAITPYLPPGWREAQSAVVDDVYSLVVGNAAARAGVARYHLLYVGATRLARSFELDEVLRAMSDDVLDAVALGARRRIFVDMGVAVWDRRAVLVLGGPRTGRSTLVDALAAAGATRFSDRYAVIDARGCVHPYPAPDRWRRGEGGRSGQGDPADRRR